MTNHRLIAVDLFAGAGGMSLGMEQAGFDVLVAVDHDPVHLATHEHNFPLSASLCSHIENVSGELIRAAGRKAWSSFGREGEWDGTVDCLVGGPSCQGFSCMGSMSTDDRRNDLIFQFARLVGELQPRSFVMENVPGLAAPRHKDALSALLRRLKCLGYTLWADRPVCLDAADHGVPQTRKRVFIVGTSSGVQVAIPEQSDPVTVGDALRDLPQVSRYSSLRITDRLILSEADLLRLRSRGSPYSESLRAQWQADYPRTWSQNELTGCQRTDHLPEVIQRFARLAQGEPDHVGRTQRLERDGTSPTLRAGTGRDHGSFTAPRPIHYSSPRVITIREAARLHSFPDWYQLHRTKWHGLRQIGNAVPPRLAYAVATKVARALGQVEPSMTPRGLKAGPRKLLTFSLHQAADHFDFARSQLPADVRTMPGHRATQAH